MLQIRVAVIAASLVFSITACQSNPHRAHASMPAHGAVDPSSTAQEYQDPIALDLKKLPNLPAIIAQLETKRVVFVGEAHDRYDHHLNQLEIIKALHKKKGKIAIGMEFFQRPFQVYMDQYIAGTIDEAEFLRKTEYFERWRIDYRNYRPIIRYAQENHIPLVALDIRSELRHKIGLGGAAQLSEAEKAELPREIDRSDQAYRERLGSIFSWHPTKDDGRFDNFVEAQLTRDEAMAESAADFLVRHADTGMVVLAGAGHIAYGSGIPQRLQRRLPVTMAIVLNDIGYGPEPDLGDFLLLPNPVALPPAGMMGVGLGKSEAGGVRITEVAPLGAAAKAGIERQDVLLMIGDQPMHDLADIKISLLDKKPGDKVSVTLLRDTWFGQQKRINLELSLQP